MKYSIRLLEEKLKECERNLAWYEGRSCQLFQSEKEKRIRTLKEQIPDLENTITNIKILVKMKKEIDYEKVNDAKEYIDSKLTELENNIRSIKR